MDVSLEKQSKAQLIEGLNQLESTNQGLTKTINCQEQQIAWMSHQIAQIKRLMHGSKRERFIAAPNQMSLPFEVEQQQEATTVKQEISYKREKKKQENHPGRNTLPAHLPVEEVIIEPKDKPQGAVKIGELITDELEYKPAELFVKRYIRPKYSLGKEEGIVVGSLPSRPIEKAIAGPGLLAQILVDKFVDHLPIYRQIERWKRWEVKLSASTINHWQEKTCALLAPLYDCLQQQVLGEGYLQVDETPIRVLDKNKKGKTHQGYYWVYHSPIRKAVFFDYRKGRSREGPRELLEDFTGYLQTDGYKAYDWFARQKGITMLSCMAHTRRYFEQALENDKPKAEYVLTQIQQLYAIEKKARQENLNSEQRHALRLDEALPIVNTLGKYIAEHNKYLLPKSAIGKAFNYAIERWDNLLNYLHDGSLEVDNNLVENAIRPNALGRKNYLFAGSHHGAHRAAMIYSFFGTCKAHGVNPYLWLKNVLNIIPEHKANKLYQLLPYNFNQFIDKM